MGKHIRQAIREDIAARLANHGGLGEVAIISARSRPIHFSGTGKALQLVVARETSLPFGNAAKERRYTRTMTLQIIGYVCEADEAVAANLADALSLQVEEALSFFDIPTALITDCWLEQTDFALDTGSYANAAFAQSWQIETSHQAKVDA